MTQSWIVFLSPTPSDAVAITVANGAVGYYSGVPLAWSGIAESEGWVYPCKVTLDDGGNIIAWEAV